MIHGINYIVNRTAAVYHINTDHQDEEFVDTEFIDEYTYDDDCLGIKDRVVKNLEQQLVCEAERIRIREVKRKIQLEQEAANS